MEFVAKEKFSRTAPDKIRILTSMLKGKNTDWALSQLEFCGKAASLPLILAIKQAKDQVKDKGEDLEKFLVKEIRIDEGPKLKRRRIKHQGRATAILKRGSHVTVTLSDEMKSKAKSPLLKELKEIKSKEITEVKDIKKATKGSK